MVLCTHKITLYKSVYLEHAFLNHFPQRTVHRQQLEKAIPQWIDSPKFSQVQTHASFGKSVDQCISGKLLRFLRGFDNFAIACIQFGFTELKLIT